MSEAVRRKQCSVLGAGDWSWIRSNLEWLAELGVDADDTFQADELSIPEAEFQRLCRRGLTEKVAAASDTAGDGATWRLGDGVRDAIDDAIADADWLPCGHRPFRNPRGVDGYTCLVDACDAIYTRGEIRAALRSNRSRADAITEGQR
ncbi:hypothetical protein [Halobaculum sp. D14]|uniref:hypothetical protein n=1 Tax=Halobaculum sp. D14 TaxID=3421642 RepID=UPI003EBEB0CF